MSRPEVNRARRGHDFYPAPGTIAALYGTEGVPIRERIVAAHYFIGGCDWWVVEYDPDEALAFGYACLADPQCAEWGYVSLVELEGVLARGVFPVERDLLWTPKPAKDCKLPGSAF